MTKGSPQLPSCLQAPDTSPSPERCTWGHSRAQRCCRTGTSALVPDTRGMVAEATPGLAQGTPVCAGAVSHEQASAGGRGACPYSALSVCLSLSVSVSLSILLLSLSLPSPCPCLYLSFPMSLSLPISLSVSPSSIYLYLSVSVFLCSHPLFSPPSLSLFLSVSPCLLSLCLSLSPSLSPPHSVSLYLCFSPLLCGILFPEFHAGCLWLGPRA